MGKQPVFKMANLPKWEPYIPIHALYPKDEEYKTPDEMAIHDWDGITVKITNLWQVEYSYKALAFRMHIHPGFVTDGGSIPKMFWGIISPFGKGLFGYLVHDALYGTHYTSKNDADMSLYNIHSLTKVGYTKSNLIYQSVNWFGNNAYNSKSQDTIDKNRDLIDFQLR